MAYPTGQMTYLRGITALCCMAMLWLLLTGHCAAAQTPQSAHADDALRELWTGTLYTATFRMGVCVTHAGVLRGVLLLRHKNGDEDVYHVHGTVDNGHIRARHNSGHVFEGYFVGEDRVHLNVTLKGGRILHLEGVRIRDPAMRLDTCRPIE